MLGLIWRDLHDIEVTLQGSGDKSWSSLSHLAFDNSDYCRFSVITFTVQEKPQMLAKCHETQFITVTQREIWGTLQTSSPFSSNVLRWVRSFFETRNLAHCGGNSRPWTSQKKVGQVRELFRSDLALSICDAACRLEISSSTVHHVSCDRLFLFPYKLQSLQALVKEDREEQLKFAKHYVSHPDGYSS